MNIKRGFAFLVFSIFLISLVSAQSIFQNLDLGDGVRQIIDQAISFGGPIFELVLNDYSSSEFFFAKIMVLILLIVVIHFILEKMPMFHGYNNIAILVSIIVSVLAVRFISENDLINGILLPYGTLGVVLATIFPFLIFGWGIHSMGMNSLGRRIGWLIFGVIFFILWIYKSSQLSPLSNQIYLWTLVAMLGMFIFDKRIDIYLSGGSIKNYDRDLTNQQISRYQVELSDLRRSGASSPDIERRIKKIERELRHLNAKRASL